MNLKELLVQFKEELSGIYEVEEIAAIFNLLVEHVTGFNNRQLSLKGISTEMQDEFAMWGYLGELKTGKPVQYVIGEASFYGLKFKVNPAVLIPRPETEELVEWVIESCMVRSAGGLAPSKDKLSIFDIGTGSGCIAVTLARKISGSRVTGLDVSSEAIEAAKMNALLNSVGVTFVQGDILDNNLELNPDGKYDVIVSNPPYITPEEKEQMHQNVLDHEPHLALFVAKERPLVFYEAIADFAMSNLTSGGLLFFEINEHMGKETMQMLVDKSFINIVLRKDMQGKDRMIRCSLGT
ncbi:peptide chain release factor N(5)-glutamine methyltransferase [Pedobacter psychroterrae]|uniref:peptide chain release factor N(5)-glutamine methyltransferase n=1 Tax=Pedobacter psychroterrae TaxID=2530453 RepID=A0A4R0NI28_9SPHI|nr:peptide chain release factor N(5)-glutamine methyltransferase [Pedobacter psychroterrae]TCD00126.1 peptide chain release factor N(5)-glutamine methyltransferase [Pedobacter psychroterrae]